MRKLQISGLLAVAALGMAAVLASCSGTTETGATIGAAAPAGPDLEANKQIAVAFYDAAINQKDYEAASQYLGDRYIQHNPTAGDGGEALKGFIDFLKAKYPNQHGEIKRVIAEGDLVALHVHSTRDNSPDRAIIDVFRIENGKVVEHWDVIQDVPAESKNPNTMF